MKTFENWTKNSIYSLILSLSSDDEISSKLRKLFWFEICLQPFKINYQIKMLKSLEQKNLLFILISLMAFSNFWFSNKCHRHYKNTAVWERVNEWVIRSGCGIVFLFWLWALLCKGTVGSLMTKTITESRLHLKFQISLIKICISPINIEVCVFLNFFIVAHYNFSFILFCFLSLQTNTPAKSSKTYFWIWSSSLDWRKT